MLGKGLLYFVVALGAGLLAETGRFLWLTSGVAEGPIDIVEAAVVLAVAGAAARSLVREGEMTRSRALGMGVTAAVSMLALEYGLVAPLLDLTVAEYAESREPLQAIIHYSAMGLFALIPVAFATPSRRSSA